MVCVLLNILFFTIMVKSCSSHNKLIEQFNDEMYFDMSDHDKNMYHNVIKTFKEILDRSPSIDELYSEFRKIKNKTQTYQELRNKLKNSEEYKSLLEDTQYHEVYKEPKKLESTRNEESVKKLLMELMPLMDYEELFDDAYIAYLVMKYKSMGKNSDEMKNYILMTPEYTQYCKLFDQRDSKTDTLNNMAPFANESKMGSDNENVDDDDIEEEYDVSSVYLEGPTMISEETDDDDEVVPIISSSMSSTPLSFHIDEPDTNKRERIKLRGCKYDNEFEQILNKNKDPLSKIQMKRNMDELMYHCEKEKKCAMKLKY